MSSRRNKDIMDIEFRLPSNDLKLGIDQVDDFEFSRENARKLDLGFKTNAIERGADVITKAHRNRRRG